MNDVKVLTKAKAHLQKVGLNQDGAYFGPEYPVETATCCAIGAIVAANGFRNTWGYNFSGERWLFNAHPDDRALTDWNDDPSTSLQDVLDLYDRAIALASA